LLIPRERQDLRSNTDLAAFPPKLTTLRLLLVTRRLLTSAVKSVTRNLIASFAKPEAAQVEYLQEPVIPRAKI
jgi:hypothetical protein